MDIFGAADTLGFTAKSDGKGLETLGLDFKVDRVLRFSWALGKKTGDSSIAL